MGDHCDLHSDIDANGSEEDLSCHKSKECSHEPPSSSENAVVPVDENESEEDLTGNTSKESSHESPNSNENDVVVAPQSGMTFDSENEARSYYAKYANQEGFSIMTRSSKKCDGKAQYFVLACSKEGYARPSKRDSASSKKSKREHIRNASMKQKCEARITLSLCTDGTYQISYAALDHNHELTPGQVKNNTYIDMRIKRTLDKYDQPGELMNKGLRSLVAEAGDADALHKYFLRMQEQDNNFFYAIDLDDCFRVRNVFWADGRSRVAYKSFGDVVTIDATYLINQYKTPLVAFVGANHHGQSILFGCGLSSCDNTDSFVWLFQSWLECMSDIPPNGIITDQCKPLEDAVKIVFPSTRRRWYLWLIMKKFRQKIHGYAKYKSISLDLQDVVYDSLTVNEFELNWKKMVERYGLDDHKWLKELFVERHRWAPTFVRVEFWAGMSTTQREENTHAFFDRYVNRQTTVKQFLDHYDKALADKAEREFEADFHSFSSTLSCATNSLVERQFQSAYTLSKFQEVQEEFIGKADCNVCVAHDDGSVCHYKVIEDMIIQGKSKEVMFEVTFDRINCDVKCMCRLFEFRGILCRHSLAILSHERVKEVPCKYILDRWRKNLKRRYTDIKTSYGVKQLEPQMERFDLLCKQFDSVAEVAAEYEEASSFVKSTLSDLKHKLGTWAIELRNSSEVMAPTTDRDLYISSLFGIGDASI